MERFYTLREFGALVHLSPETLRDRIAAGRLEAVRQYRGGNRSDPRSWRWLVPDNAATKFIKAEMVAACLAGKRGYPCVPAFMRRKLRDELTGRFRSSG